MLPCVSGGVAKTSERGQRRCVCLAKPKVESLATQSRRTIFSSQEEAITGWPGCWRRSEGPQEAPSTQHLCSRVRFCWRLPPYVFGWDPTRTSVRELQTPPYSFLSPGHRYLLASSTLLAG
jgi:hypothetical protein